LQVAIKNIKIKVFRTIILSVLCGCETWSLTSREESRLRVLENIWAYGERRSAYRILVGKPEGRRPLGRHWRKSEMDLQEVGWAGLIWLRRGTGGGHL
jgi:hypothetical protein